MANSLTNEFDIVAEFGVDVVNRILAAQHQVSGPDQIYLHGVRTVIRTYVLEGIWGLAEIQISTPTISLPTENSSSVVAATGTTPILPGFTEEAEPTVSTLADTEFRLCHEGSRVAIHFQMRVRFRPDPGSSSVPEFVHGELQVISNVDQVISFLENVVSISLDSKDLSISFVPDPGAPLSTEERSLVTKAARHFITHELGALNFIINLPPVTDGFGLSHWRFKTLPHSSKAAVALLLNMHPDHIPTDAQHESYNNNFLKDSDSFAFAIGSDFLVPTLRDLLEGQILNEVAGNSYTVKLPIFSDPTYEVGLVDKPGVVLKQDAIEITVSLTATTDNWTPNASLTLTQRVGISAASQSVNLDLVGDLSFSLSFSGGFFGWVANRIKFLFEDKVKNAVSTALVQAINQAEPRLQEALSEAKVLTEKLRIPPPQLTYNAVDISAAGIVVHGDLKITNWQPVVVSFDSRRLVTQNQNPQVEFSALKSWIPGGTIQRYHWRLLSSSSTVTEVVHDHQFTMKLPSQIRTDSLWAGWCLEVIGHQDGKLVTGSNCGLIGPPVVSWPGNGAGAEEDQTLPVSVLDSAGNLIAHVDLSGSGNGRRPRDVRPANVLIHFAGSDAEATLALLGDVLPQLDLGEKQLMIISVVDPGTLSSDCLKGRIDNSNAYLVWAEDFEGSWARSFKVREGNPVFLVTPPDGIVWRSSPKPEVEELAEALKEYLKDTGIPPLRLLQPALREYEKAPNFLFDYASCNKMKLSTLRGRPVYINFFKPWSQPCLNELQRLHMLRKQQSEQGGVILVVADGQDGLEAQNYFKQHGYQFKIVADPNRQISRRYGIIAWPTTITVDVGGFIKEIRSGSSSVRESWENNQAY